MNGPSKAPRERRMTSLLLAECDFPGCGREAITDAPMCDVHRRVSVSRTGSWLEAG